MNRSHFLIAAALVATSAAPALAGDAAAGKATYDSLCASCHGATGKGDGPTGAAFPTKPRDFTDAAWQSATDDAKIGKAITGGGPAVGLTPFMPPFAQLSADDVANVVAYIRSLGTK